MTASKLFLICLFVLTASHLVPTANAATRYSVASGNWSSTSTWATKEGGASGASVPGAADSAVISGGKTVTVDIADAACASLQLGSTSSTGGNGTLAFNAGSQLTCSGNVVVGSTAGPLPDRTGSLNFGSGGLLKIGGAVTVTVLGTFTPGSGTIEYNGAGAQTIVNTLGNYHNLVVSGGNIKSLTTNVTVNGDLSVNSATLDLNARTANRASAGGTFTLADGASLLIGGAANFPGNYSTVILGAASTVGYDRAGAQTVLAQSYGNLALTGSGAKTMTGVVSITGDLTLGGTATTTTGANLEIGGNLGIGNGAGFTAGAFALTVTGTTTVGGGTSGNLTISSATGTKIFTGLVTVNAGATWNNSGNSPVTFRGGISSIPAFTGGSGVQTFDTASQTLGGTFTIPSVTVTGVTLTNSGTLTVATALSGTGGLTQGAGATLNIGGTSGITTLTGSASGNTITYNGAAQTVHNNDYFNLTLSGSGNKDFGASSISIGGTFSNSAGTMVAGASTITFTGNPGVISGSSSKNFYELIINSGAVVTSSGGNVTVSKDFTNNGTFTQVATVTTTFDSTRAHNLSGVGTTTFGNVTLQGSPTVVNAGSHNFSVLGNWSITSGGIFNPGTATVTFASATAAQSIGGSATSQTFNNLAVNKAGQTLSVATVTTLNLSGGLTLTAGTFAAGTATTINIAGNWTNNSSATAFTAGSGIVTFNGVTAQSISGSQSTTFNNLSIANAVCVAVTRSITVTNCTINPGDVLSGVGPITGPVVVNGTVSPGSSPGTLTTGAETWNGGGSYTWEINDATGAPGTGYDQINVGAGAITIGATSGNKFTLKLVTLNGASAGLAANFDNTIIHSWTIATGASVSGFAANKFAIDATGFQNSIGGGTFSVEQSGNNLQLKFTPGVAPSNPIVTENALTGNPSSEWDIVGFGDATIQGFATDMSVNQGDTVHFKIDTDAAAYQIKIYRLGYYGGDGARNVANILPTATLPQVQPDPITDPSTGLLDCGNWAESASWAVPSDAVSGVYIAKLIRTDTLGASHIVFIVRDDAGASDLVFQTPDQTWQAYNTYGGDSLYTGSGPGEGLSGGGRAYKVSYNRPILDRTDGALQTSYTWLFGAPYPMIRWLEANGYNVSYISGLDTARHGDLLTQHKAFLSVGHDEYWSAQQRTNVETALAAGLNLAFLSGNEMFWKTRWEPSIDGSATPNRTLVCYKETHAGAKIDPSPLWTGTWRDPRFSPPSDGGRPENALSGTLFAVNGYTPIDSIKVPFAYSGHRLWRNTSVAALTSGQTAVFPAGTLGFEWDESPVNGFQPAGQMLLSSNTVGGLQILKDYGSVYQTAEATHRLSLYRSASGALVFGAGTVQWSWGLDATHDNSIGSPVSLDMQQATVNLFADMGVQPGSPQAGLTPATESTDHTAPTSTILSPIAGGSFPAGSPVTISGTAADTGGGVVWGVEVSTDGGTTWRPALGRESWSFTWVPAISGPVTLKSRAVDDSGNLEVPSAGVSGSVPDQITIWTGPVSPTPGDDAASYEVGVKFRSDVDGYITGIRFYQTVGNGGTHIGNLWTTAGVNLASATFAEETGSGWQQVNFDTPVPITAGVTYVASYFDPRGNYAYSLNYFTTAVDNPPLHALADSSGDHNGVYVASSTTAFPNLGNSSAVNYWVDPVFVETIGPDTTDPTVTGVSPVGGATGVRLNTAVTVTFSEAMNAGTITGGGITLKAGVTPVAANVTYNAGTRTATLTPTSSLSLSTVYTVTVAGTITDLAGNPLVSYAPFSFTTTDQASYSIWTGPVSPMAGTDPGSYELGVKFRSDIDGYVTGIRFYQTAGNGGTHVGNLWNLAGVNLGSATFSGEAGSGWQQVNFASPVAISAGVTYVASYFDPQGHYAVDSPYFTAAVDNPPLHALADGTDGGNGVYVITGTSAYPNQSGSGKANYWVDVVFVESIGPDVTPPTVTGKSPADLATGVSVNTAVTVTFSEAMDSTKFTGTTFSLNPTTPATVTYDAGTKTATLAPTGPLANSTVYTVTVLGDAAGVTDVAGNPLTGNTVWSFTTEAPDVTPPTVTGVSPVGGATGVRLNTAVTVTFSEAMNAGTITGGGITLKAGVTPVAANVTYNAGTRTATLTPTSSLSLSTVYTVTVAGTITDLAGNPLVSYAPFSFTTTDQASYNIWPGPVSPMAGTDPGSYELGVRFRSDIDGYVTGIRFYQTAGNGGTHVGNLWNLAGVNLGSATFSGETGSGWQQVNFASPVAISAGVTYVASYFDPQGHYAFNNPDFTTGVDNPPLHALASGAGGNGVLVATSVSAYPANVSGSAANYWVDVVFGKPVLTITATNQSKTYGSTVTFAGTEFTVSGLLPGDSVSDATLTSAGAEATASAAGSPYPITISDAVGTGLEKYAIVYVEGMMNVNGAPPSILSVTVENPNRVVIVWSAISNVTYRVQYTPDFSTEWMDLVPDVTATGSTATTVANPEGAEQAFYRLVVVP